MIIERFFPIGEHIMLKSRQGCNTILKSWIPLDSQYTVAVFYNLELLKIIQESKPIITLCCNAGKVYVNQKGNLRGYGAVWYNTGAIANILSIYNVHKIHMINYDSTDGHGLTVHKVDGPAMY